jgi:hypothetical protein
VCCKALLSFFRYLPTDSRPDDDFSNDETPTGGMVAVVLPIILDVLNSTDRYLASAKLRASAAHVYSVLLCHCNQREMNEWTARLINPCLVELLLETDSDCTTDAVAPTCMVACRLLANQFKGGLKQDEEETEGTTMRDTTISFLSTLLREKFNSGIVGSAAAVLALLIEHDSDASQQLVRAPGAASSIVGCLNVYR